MLNHAELPVQPFLCQQRETLGRPSFAVVSSPHGLAFLAVVRETAWCKEEEGRKWGEERRKRGSEGLGREEEKKEGVGREEEEERDEVREKR